MTVQQLLTDNPILVKHVRSRLRRTLLLPAIAATVLLCAMILWIAVASDSIRNGIAFGFLVVLQGGVLFLGGASQVGTSVCAGESVQIDREGRSFVPWAAGTCPACSEALAPQAAPTPS